MNKKQLDFHDLNFIYEKVIWYLEQKPAELMEYFQKHHADSLYTIQDKKLGLLICGREASEKFYDIAKRHLSSQKQAKNKINLDDFAIKIKEEFSRKFLQNGEDRTENNVEKMINSAFRSISKDFEELIHYIPCSIFVATSIKSFEIGPVLFLQKSEFKSTCGDEIDSLRFQIKEDHQKDCAAALLRGYPANIIGTEKDSEELANYLVDGLQNAYEFYDWIAIVKILRSNESVSYDKAIFVTKAALNILKLMYGSYLNPCSGSHNNA